MAFSNIFLLNYKKIVAKIVTDYKNCYIALLGQAEGYL